MSRGGGSKHKYTAKGDDTGNPKPNINSINSGQNRLPAFNSSSVTGAGYNGRMPYLSGGGPKPPSGISGINNVFNVPKYGQGGLGGGIGGGIGSYGSLGGGIGGIGHGGPYNNPTGSAGSNNK